MAMDPICKYQLRILFKFDADYIDLYMSTSIAVNESYKG